ncbi:alginate lyase family protein [Cytophaga aurantiaca]|uniref:alginate lyase family protein n=1 Tax=Cytophaga aurantiaca TaxID=29530 RepID=UPI000372F7AB|nr:alginate lyase family protein [Cytophaga aurantiaca]
MLKLKVTIILFILLFLSLYDKNAFAFKHPAGFSTENDLLIIKQKVNAQQQPWLNAFIQLQNSNYGKLSYVHKAYADVICGSHNNPNIGCNNHVDDAMSAYAHALQWYITGNQVHATKAISILNDWSKTYQSNQDFNDKLVASWATPWFVNAAEIIRYSNAGWSNSDIAQFKNMLNKLYSYASTGAMFNNGYASQIEAQFAIAIFLDDQAKFNKAVSEWKNFTPTYIYLRKDGATPKTGRRTISVWGNTSFIDGLCMETCRDYGHAKLGFNSIIGAASIAWSQDIDLFNIEKDRLKAFMELHASWSRGVSAVPSSICGGNVLCTGQSNSPIMPCGNDGWEIAYRHLNNRLSMSMPQSLAMINASRPSGMGRWNKKPETLIAAQIPFGPVATCNSSIISQATSFCTGSSLVLTASVGSSYKWFKGTTQVGTAATYTATTAGSYTVEVTNSDGCKSTSAAKVLTVNPLPLITYNVNANGNWTAASTATVCATTNVIVGPWPVVETGWNWIGPNNFTAHTREINLNNIQANQSGIYTTTYTDPNGCSATGTFNIQVNAIPTATISSPSNSFCPGGSVVLTASAGASYKWLNGTTQVGTAATYTATTAGSYTVEVTNASGCKATSPAKVITVNQLPVIAYNVNTNGNWTAASTATVCATTNVIVGPWPVVETGWSWTGPNNFTATTREIYLNNTQANQSGIYTATYRDANGCSASGTFNLQVNATTLWYADTDNDGKGDPATTVSSCAKPTGYVAIAGDACPTDANKITPGNCGCNKTEASCLDCAGVANGTAIIDACNKCAGGTTGIAIVTDPGKCVTTNITTINGPLCVSTGTSNAYSLSTNLSVASINWWSNSGASITKDPANPKNMQINFPSYANGTNATLTAGVNLNAAPWYQEFTLLVKVGGCTGSTPQLRAAASPLPFNTSTTIMLENDEVIHSIKIVDMNGIEVFNADNINTTAFELGNNFNTGLYIAYVTSNKGTSIIKLVKSY